MIDIASIKHKDRLAPYAQEILEGLIPLLKRLDFYQLSSNSFVAVEEHKGNFTLRLDIISCNEGIPGLGLSASQDHCVLGFADSERIEAFGLAPKWQDLIGQILTATERYLNGITVVEYYNRNHKLVKTEYFYGLDTEGDKDSKIGTSSYPFIFPRKIDSVVKRTHRFLK